jgi:hypothetical protein
MKPHGRSKQAMQLCKFYNKAVLCLARSGLKQTHVTAVARPFSQALSIMRISVLFAMLANFAVEAAEPFFYEHKLAVDLATAYVRSHFRKRPEHAVPGLSFKDPIVRTVIAKEKRNLIVVSFSSSEKPDGAFVMLEQCKENGLLVVVESGVVDNVERYRKEISGITTQTFIEAPSGCP